MDIWAWFHDETTRIAETDPALASRLEWLPSWVVDQRHEQVDAVLPELLAAARRLKRPWLEVFVRHWRLQSWIFQRHDVVRGMPEALQLLERAHRDDMAGCPQTTCVSQDVCAATGFADGPGYAEDRLRISAETLSRIDPSWPCWSCISSEHMSALVDAGRHEDALAWATEQRAAMAEAGQPVTTGEFAWDTARALLALDRHEEALQVVEEADAPGKGEHFLREKVLQRAKVLAVCGRDTEAMQVLPPFARIADTPSLYQTWTEARIVLLGVGTAPWTAEATRELAFAAHRLAALGCPRQALNVAVRTASVCAGSDSREVGAAFLDLARAQLPNLRAPLGADEAIEAVAERLAELEAVDAPATLAEAHAILEGEQLRIDAVVAAWRAFPDDPRLALAVARGWRAFGFDDRARDVLQQVHAAQPDDGAVFLELGQALTSTGDLEALDALVAGHPDPSAEGEVAGHAAWLRAHAAESRGDLAGAAAALQALLEARPEWCAPPVPARIAALHRRLGNLDAAVDAYTAAIDKVGEASSLDWDRMTVASLAGRWDLVRDSAMRLGMPVDAGDTPIAEDWGICRVQFDGEDRPIFARRTGPVTATVLQICGPGRAEHYEDQVVFDAQRIDEDGDDAPPVFRVEGVARPGEYIAASLDGAHPGDDVLEALGRKLAEHDVAMQVTSSEQYVLTHPESGAGVRGVYVRVALPDSALADAVHTAFAAVEDHADGPLVWPELLALLGRADEARRHVEVAGTWGM